MKDLVRRPMNEADLAEVLQIERSANRFPWSKQNFADCLSGNYQSWVYQLPDSLAGYLIVQNILDEAHLLNICVQPQHQGKGIGRFMLEQMINDAQQRQAKLIVLEVRRSNHRAQQLYLQQGFNEMSIRRGYYPAEQGREDAVLMGLDLSLMMDFAE